MQKSDQWTSIFKRQPLTGGIEIDLRQGRSKLKRPGILQHSDEVVVGVTESVRSLEAARLIM
jgi:hypothetical protein